MDLTALRRQIDRLDRRMLELLNRRAELALLIGREKRRQGRPIHDPEREAAIIARLLAANRGPLGEESLSRIYRLIMRESCRLEAESSPEPTADKKGANLKS